MSIEVTFREVTFREVTFRKVTFREVTFSEVTLRAVTLREVTLRRRHAPNLGRLARGGVAIVRSERNAAVSIRYMTASIRNHRPRSRRARGADTSTFEARSALRIISHCQGREQEMARRGRRRIETRGRQFPCWGSSSR